jgi:predicted RNase H-like HicB family nuclease
MRLTVEFDREEDGRWIAEVLELAGVLAYGESREAALQKVKEVAPDHRQHGRAGRA